MTVLSEVSGMIESRLKENERDLDQLVERWAKFIAPIDQYNKDNGQKSLSLMSKRNVARCLENALLESGYRNQSRLFETTDQSNIAFLGVKGELCPA